MNEYNKNVVNIEVLNLDELGYGPEGKHTRRQWQAKCLESLLMSKDDFIKWQQQCEANASKNVLIADFSVVVHYDDASPRRLERTSYAHSLDLCGCTFENEMDLSGHHFMMPVFFINTTYISGLNFNDAVFEQVVDFNSSNFKGVDFREARFNRSAYFKGAVFEGNARYRKAVFENVVDFRSATFLSDARFGSVAFHRDARFQEICCYEKCDFENSEFRNVGHFEGAQFLEGDIPRFRGCKIGETRLEFSGDAYFTQADFSEDAIKNISFLKRLADEHGQTDQALNFNAMELRAKRLNALNGVLLYEAPDRRIFLSKWWETCFTYAYEKAADFGRSFTKPLFWMLVVLVISLVFGLAAGYLNPPPSFHSVDQNPFLSLTAEIDDTKYIGISGYRAAAEYSLYHSGNFLDFSDADKNTASINMRLFGGEVEPWWARCFGFLKGLTSAVLIFLVGLGIRNKYRVG